MNSELVVHNYYRNRGGEDNVVEAEVALLRANGHDVELYARHNDDLADAGSVSAGLQAVWSRRTSAEIGAKAAAFRPELIHAHNTFPLISPSLYWVADENRIPIVQTLHNFRLLCPQAMFLRAQRVCEDCMRRVPWRSVTRKCYRNSALQSAAAASMLQFHRALGTYTRKVTGYIALTEFSRAKFIEGGMPADRIAVKPNFVDIPHYGQRTAREGFLFAGRLAAKKGVGVLAAAIAGMPTAKLEVLGEGPEGERLGGLKNVALLGYQPEAHVSRSMLNASALIVPSVCYENFPRTIVEAFACRLPVVDPPGWRRGPPVQAGVLEHSAGSAGGGRPEGSAWPEGRHVCGLLAGRDALDQANQCHRSFDWWRL